LLFKHANLKYVKLALQSGKSNVFLKRIELVVPFLRTRRGLSEYRTDLPHGAE